MNKQQERDHYVNAVVEILSLYDHELAVNGATAINTATQAFLQKFYPTTATSQIEAFVRMSLLNIENMILIAGGDEVRLEEVRNSWGHIANCLVDVAMGDWQKLNKDTLQ